MSTRVPPLAPPESWEDQLSAVGIAAEAWLGHRRAAGRLYADLPDSRIGLVRARFPEEVEHTIAAAERAIRHEFDLLGSGACVPVDPNRPPSAEGYQPIDWALDPICKLRFPEGFPHSAWNWDMRPGLADIKLPWEIGRCQHWVTLGQAYRLTGDERYAREIVRQHGDFLEANPVGRGVQYTCTMDVAIRALNWALAFELIRQSQALTSPAMHRAYASMFDVGTFIERNLENKYEVTSNHFLSNVAGLYGLGVVFADLSAGRRWLKQGRAWFEQEMKVQILPDGADYESSVPYHRLVTELFLSGARLAELEGHTLSDEYLGSLRRMVEFLIEVTRPDGLLPQIGDADDGRLHIFTGYGSWKPQDARHVVAPAAFILRESSWLDSCPKSSLWEAAWWGCDIDALLPTPGRRSAARLFEQAGIAVARTEHAFLIVTNSRVGTNGFGNHKHNDSLSFEFHSDGQPVIVDPGSYVYTSDPDARNLFRGTAYHNTLRIDGVEQNDMKPEHLFRLYETSKTEHLRFDETPEHVEYVGRHTGYERLPNPVTHERAIRLYRNAAALRVVDRLHGSGLHKIDWHFHLAPGVTAERTGRDFILECPAGRWRLHPPEALTGSIASAWYSPSYGVRMLCEAIDFTLSTVVSSESTFQFLIGPESWVVSGAH